MIDGSLHDFQLALIIKFPKDNALFIFKLALFIRQIHNKLKSHNQVYTLKKESLIKCCSSVTRKKRNMEGKIFFFKKT